MPYQTDIDPTRAIERQEEREVSRKRLNLYLIKQDINSGWDTHDSAVVVAETAEAAILIHPYGDRWDSIQGTWMCGDGTSYGNGGTWATPEHVTAELVGNRRPRSRQRGGRVREFQRRLKGTRSEHREQSAPRRMVTIEWVKNDEGFSKVVADSAREAVAAYHKRYPKRIIHFVDKRYVIGYDEGDGRVILNGDKYGYSNDGVYELIEAVDASESEGAK